MVARHLISLTTSPASPSSRPPSPSPSAPRSLLKARALVVDPALTSCLLTTHFTAAKQLPDEVQREILVLADGLYGCITTRVREGQGLPRVKLVVGNGGDEQKEVTGACVKYALYGMEHGVFVELCELMVPAWDRGNM